MHAGKKNAHPIPQSNPTTMNMGRVFEKESMTIATIDTRNKYQNNLFFAVGVEDSPSKDSGCDHHYSGGGKEEPRICYPALNCIQGEESREGSQTNSCRKLAMAGTTIFQVKKKGM